MKNRLWMLVLVALPILVGGGYALTNRPMSAPVIAILGAVMIWLGYTTYARHIDQTVIQPDAKKATPARMYMDGVDFMPTSRNVLYGYHFKSIAAAGPIVGPIAAVTLWGWLPSLLWLTLGVTFLGWASDYSAIMVAVRNDGNSLSAIAHRLIAPRARVILFVFIFFYLLLLAGAFVGIMAGIFDPRADVPFGIVMLAIMGILMGQMLYRWKMDLIVTTVLAVGLTMGAMALGAKGMMTVKGTTPDGKPGAAVVFGGPVNSVVEKVNDVINQITGGKPLYTVVDPTRADPRLVTTMVNADGKIVPKYVDSGGAIKMLPSFIFWCVFIFAFSYLGTVLPIWRFAQPTNYIGFWVTFLTIGFSALGAVVAGIRGMLGNAAMDQAVTFQSKVFAAWVPMTQAKDAAGQIIQTLPAIQPIWPMLFVTIACGAISGWHSLVGSIGTARQLEYETDALPVGGGGMFTENALALLSLVAISIAGGAGAGAFANGVGKLLGLVTFGGIQQAYGTALGFGVFVVIVLTMVQLVFRVMRVTLGEWLGDVWLGFKNPHIAAFVSMGLTLLLVLSGTWIYLWQLFGASNQLMAALSLLIVSLWLKSIGRSPRYAFWPMLFMYITTMAAIIVTGYNLYASILSNPRIASQTINMLGAMAMIVVATLLFVAAAVIAYDAWRAWGRAGKPAAASMAAD
ncbi:MAG TPA: carbon starvation CstA family protein [Candidatus Eisenbacteria bacterium]|nr:carbon starvation CstA family protein [Anaerolineales bacterium]HVP55692.1 carbon starvation CstA family protein [Candidatus Eisenbacteria bacterium]